MGQDQREYSTLFMVKTSCTYYKANHHRQKEWLHFTYRLTIFLPTFFREPHIYYKERINPWFLY